ncbi:uncharacterized protein [Triticum aestivum]|uniref:uncharacterized protein isoform X2 n=1 Tax=Triticum aestivum TaxID=4565 RepID=UPI0003D58CD5|nr:uncharacterized protein LOC123095606 isoform X2 [Triticum aestivum]
MSNNSFFSLDRKFLDETDAVLFNSCNSLEAYDAKRFIFCSLDQKFLDETDAVLFNCPNSLEAKPTAVKQRMEAMGVTGLTIWNIKSHLQRYREKCNLGAEPPRDVLGTASPSKAGDNVTSEAETVVDSDAAMNLTGMEMATYLLMDDTEMVDTAFSADELQMMEKELMNAIRA